jgi:uncharacterized protein YjdB
MLGIGLKSLLLLLFLSVSVSSCGCPLVGMIKVSPKTVTLEIGSTTQATIQIWGTCGMGCTTDTSGVYTWISQDEDIAVVDAQTGVITACVSDKTTIEVHSGQRILGSVQVTVR